MTDKFTKLAQTIEEEANKISKLTRGKNFYIAIKDENLIENLRKNNMIEQKKLTFLEQYVQDAIRTESRIDELKFDKNMVIKLFTMYTKLGEILDGLKKSIYYGKDEKLILKIDNLQTISVLADNLYSELTINEVDNFDPTIDGTTWEEDIKSIINSRRKEIITNIPQSCFHGILGIMTESSEMAEIILNLLNDSSKDVDIINLFEELGDQQWYQAILHNFYNRKMENTFLVNINKLKVRFKSKFNNEDANNRNLILERQELENEKTN